jgi:hypothetical protein
MTPTDSYRLSLKLGLMSLKATSCQKQAVQESEIGKSTAYGTHATIGRSVTLLRWSQSKVFCNVINNDPQFTTKFTSSRSQM